MQLVLPLLAISIVTIIGLFSSKKIITLKNHIEDRATPTVTKAIVPKKTLTPTVTHTPTLAPTNTSIPQQSNNTSDFTYPGSQNTGGNTFESTDNPDTITRWYKDKIKSMGFNTKSFVTTKTNNNVNNVLSAASGSVEITVEITKMSGDTTTHIKIVQ